MGKKSAATKPAASDRQAKIDAAAKATKPGANKIIIGTVVALVAIITVVAGVIIADQMNKPDSSSTAAALPAGVAQMGDPFVANADVTVQDGAPTLAIFEDFRCPHCHQAYAVFHTAVADLASSGKVKLEYHFKTVIDSNSGGSESLKAASSAMCAAAAGQFDAYHQAIFDGIVNAGGTQPQWGPAFFTETAEQVGISGDELTAFNECVADGRYDQYIRSVDEESARNGVNSTPVYQLNGETIDFTAVNTPELLIAAVENATGQ